MIRLLALWAYLAGLDPLDATALAAHVCGLQRFEDEALAIVRSESRNIAVGVHVGHTARVEGHVFWRRAVDRGLLNLGECEYHTPGEDGGAGWGIRGAHGLAAAYSIHHLGWCVRPEAVDVPYLSAVMMLKRLRVLESRYHLRTPEARTHAWVHGVGCGCDGVLE